MKKSIIGIVVIILICGLLYLFNNITTKESSEYIDSYLTNDGYELSEDGDYYVKVNSSITMTEYFEKMSDSEDADYEELYFYPSTYTLTKLKMSYSNDVSTSFSVSYNLVEEDISYKYEITIYDASIIVGGSYDLEKEEATCDVTYSNGIDEDGSNSYCTKANYEIILFLEDANELKSDYRFSKIIDEGLEEVEVTDE